MLSLSLRLRVILCRGRVNKSRADGDCKRKHEAVHDILQASNWMRHSSKIKNFNLRSRSHHNDHATVIVIYLIPKVSKNTCKCNATESHVDKALFCCLREQLRSQQSDWVMAEPAGIALRIFTGRNVLFVKIYVLWLVLLKMKETHPAWCFMCLDCLFKYFTMRSKASP